MSEMIDALDRTVLWVPWQGPGIEHLHLMRHADRIDADGVLVSLKDGTPFCMRYLVFCDAGWRTREVRIGPVGGEGRHLGLLGDGEGHWTTRAGDSVPALDGCIDVDISATPFTNTLPVRRFDLAPGDAREILALYLAVPELSVQPARQRYTCLERDGAGGRYRYESLDSGFEAELQMDRDGLVLDYPGLFRRAWPSPDGRGAD